MPSNPVAPPSAAIAWRQTPPGQYVLAWEQERLDAALADVFGFNALQLGMPEQDFLRANRIALRQTIAQPTDAPTDVRPDLLAEFSRLPIASQSIDLLLLPHVLEFHPQPHQILREAERILRPEGRLFILGFNPLSLWGLTRSLPGRTRGQPGNGQQYLSVLRLRDWLKLLDFEVDRGAFGVYVPPCKSEQWLRRWHFMELAGDRWWGFAGSVYMLRAIKRVAGMHLILPAWDTGKKLAAKALTPVTHRTHKENNKENQYGG
ncbi:MAG: class I SAM-dependent methyltransferase [Zoogloeaceae bacterium]|jgi:SAM-dependent methyltransferase|nr:class I SAM-dependent methyltransferase [Zoogloeaceae bacterium]